MPADLALLLTAGYLRHALLLGEYVILRSSRTPSGCIEQCPRRARLPEPPVSAPSGFAHLGVGANLDPLSRNMSPLTLPAPNTDAARICAVTTAVSRSSDYL